MLFQNSISKTAECTTPDNCDFFYQDQSKPDPNAKWVGPGGGPAQFYTTWSYFAIIAVSVFAAVAIPLMWKVPKLSSSKVFSTIILAVIIGFAANSLGVAVTAQGLLDFNWKPLDPHARVAISEKWVKMLNRINLKVHLFPVLLSLALLAAVVTVPWTGSKTHLYLAACAVPVIFFFIWACVPIPVSKGSSKKTNPFNKASVVYNSPPFSIEVLQPLTIFIMALLYVYVMRGRNNTQ